MRHGADARLRDQATGKSIHTLMNVYPEMLIQICRDYATLPDPRTLTLREIRFFYEGLRHELRAHTKPRIKKNR